MVNLNHVRMGIIHEGQASLRLSEEQRTDMFFTKLETEEFLKLFEWDEDAKVPVGILQPPIPRGDSIFPPPEPGILSPPQEPPPAEPNPGMFPARPPVDPE